jgi:hypothetical protein
MNKELKLKIKSLEEQLKKEKREKLKLQDNIKVLEEKNRLLEKEKSDVLTDFNNFLIKMYEQQQKPRVINIQNNNTIDIDECDSDFLELLLDDIGIKQIKDNEC